LKLNIYYYHPLILTFKTSQTLQVVRDYFYLSKLGFNVLLYGRHPEQKEIDKIRSYLNGSNATIEFSLILFFIRIFFDKNPVVVTRHYRKLEKLLLFKKIFKRNLVIIHEMHEECLPYLFKKNISKEKINKLFKNLNGMIFTNFSQVLLYKNEFSESPPPYCILPNGVEIEKFSNAKKGNKHILTYVGSFNKWKNVELIFAALSFLDKKYSLRIAGGNNIEETKLFINAMIRKYAIDSNRVDFRGYVNNKDLINQVISGSSVLLLPLGNNIQSKYLTSPMKLFEYMATNIAIVSINYPSVSLITEEGIFFSNNNPSDFASQILEADKHNSNTAIKNRRILAKKYSYEERSIKLQSFISQILL